MAKRVFLIVLDSLGIGAMEDASDYGDKGANTLGSLMSSGVLDVPHMKHLGLFNIDGVTHLPHESNHTGVIGRFTELSKGKDSVVGHWEISGLISEKPMPTFPDGFPENIIEEFSRKIGRGVICNKPYSGTEVIRDFGEEHIKSGDLIVYTSADSVFQISAHTDVVSLQKLYEYCEIAREILSGEYGVGRVIARPFEGKAGDFVRSPYRKDFALAPTGKTMLDCIFEKGLDSIAVGKIKDIFAGRGITRAVETKSNYEGIEKTLKLLDEDFHGLCFVNLVDFDMVYGHRNDVIGYAFALNEFDKALGKMIAKLRDEDLLIITADHGCDPGFKESTDHTREYIPMIMYQKNIVPVNLGTKIGFCDIGKTVCDYLGVAFDISSKGFLSEITLG